MVSMHGYVFVPVIFQRTTHEDYSALISLALSLSIAPPGINPLEHEELPMAVQQVRQNVRPSLAGVFPQTTTERQHETFSQVTVLPLSFSIKPNDTVSLYRARMDDKDVILRVLKGKPAVQDHCCCQDS